MSYSCDSFTSRDFLTSHMGVSSDLDSGHMHPMSTVPFPCEVGPLQGYLPTGVLNIPKS